MILNFKNTRATPAARSYMAIRRTIGILGIVLPFFLLIAGQLWGCKMMMESISHYYYTFLSTCFTGVLCAVGVFLITYKGYGPLDDLATNFAGICAFGVALFPTTLPKCTIFADAFPPYTRYVHYTCAALFFVTLALISLFLFTKTNPNSTAPLPKEKKISDRIYRVCGILMLIFVVLVPITSIDAIADVIGKYNPTFWCETGALLSFGTSWLTKGV